MIRVKPRYPLRIGMIGILLGAPIMVVLALAPNTVMVTAMSFLVGISYEIFGIGWETALGQHIPLDKLSRVSSYDMLGSIVAVPVGQLTVGYVAAAASVTIVELYGAALYVAITIATLVVPSVWKLRRVEG
jgi:hypothetical protein